MTLPRDRPRAQIVELGKHEMHDDDKTLTRVGPSVPCVAPAGSTAEGQKGAVLAVAKTIRAWVDREWALHEFSEVTVDEGRAIKAHAAAIAQELARESRSPDGDGLPMVKGLGDGASLPRTDEGGTAAIGQRTCALAPLPESSLKPADGSEPSDSLHTKNVQLRAQITALAQEKAELRNAVLLNVLEENRAAWEWHAVVALAEAHVSDSASIDDARGERELRAQVAALTVQLQTERADIERAKGLLEAYYNPNFGPDLVDANVWYVAQCVVEHIHMLDDPADVAALTVERARLTTENQELKKEHEDVLTRVDRQGATSDDSVPQGRTRGHQVGQSKEETTT